MANQTESELTPSSPPQAAPWALLWLSVIATGTWVPLMLADRAPGWRQQRSTSSAIEKPAGSETLIPLAPVGPSPVGAFKPFSATLPPNTAQLALDRHTPLAAQNVVAMASADSGSFDVNTAPGEPRPISPVSGSLLLGGPLGLESLQEKPMVPAARLEVALRSRTADRLEAVPAHWRPAMQALLHGEKRVLPAEVVRLPAPHLRNPEEYPMAVKPDGIAETTVTPSERSRETIERWAQRQSPNPEGSIRPVMVVLEPLAPEIDTTTTPSMAEMPDAQTNEAP